MHAHEESVACFLLYGCETWSLTLLVESSWNVFQIRYWEVCMYLWGKTENSTAMIPMIFRVSFHISPIMLLYPFRWWIYAERKSFEYLLYLFHPLLPSGVEGIPESLPLLSILYYSFHPLFMLFLSFLSPLVTLPSMFSLVVPYASFLFLLLHTLF